MCVDYQVKPEDIPKVLKVLVKNCVDLYCRECDTPLPLIVSMYPSEGGKYWCLYIECLKCKFRNYLKDLESIGIEEIRKVVRGET